MWWYVWEEVEVARNVAEEAAEEMVEEAEGREEKAVAL